MSDYELCPKKRVSYKYVILSLGKHGLSDKNSISSIYTNSNGSSISHFRTFLKALPYLWPRNKLRLRIEFILSMLFMMAAIIAELYLPIPMNRIITLLQQGNPNSSSETYTQSLQKNFILFSIATIGAALFPHIRDLLFAGINVETERVVSINTFRHLQRLSFSFYLRQETGAILRSVTRGAGTNSALIKSMIFILLPMIIKFMGVIVIFAVLFRWYFSVITSISVLCYSICTLLVTRWRDKYRRVMNNYDNEKNSRMMGKNQLSIEHFIKTPPD